MNVCLLFTRYVTTTGFRNASVETFTRSHERFKLYKIKYNSAIYVMCRRKGEKCSDKTPVYATETFVQCRLLVVVKQTDRRAAGITDYVTSGEWLLILKDRLG